MSEVIDFFTKKPIEQAEVDYKDRKQKCIDTTLQFGKCSCQYCLENDMLANKLAEISKWLMSDHSIKAQRRVYYGDWLEVAFLAALKIEQHINSLQQAEKKQDE